jgi:hypothetical protein
MEQPRKRNGRYYQKNIGQFPSTEGKNCCGFE